MKMKNFLPAIAIACLYQMFNAQLRNSNVGFVTFQKDELHKYFDTGDLIAFHMIMQDGFRFFPHENIYIMNRKGEQRLWEAFDRLTGGNKNEA